MTDGKKPGGPKLALKEVVARYSVCSVRVRATKRRRRKFSLGRSHASDRGERKPGGPKLAQKRPWRDPSAVLCECERPNVGDVNSPWGDVTLVTEGRESREARSSHKKRPWEFPRPLFVRAKGLEPIRTKAPDPKSGLATNYNTLAKPFGRLITLSPSLKSAFWKLPTSVSERITKLCIFFKNPKQPASGHSQKQSSWICPNRTGSCEAERPPCRERCGPPRN